MQRGQGAAVVHPVWIKVEKEENGTTSGYAERRKRVLGRWRVVGDLEAGDGKVGLRVPDDVIRRNREKRARAESIVLKGNRVGVLGLCEEDARAPDGGDTEIRRLIAEIASPGLTRNALRSAGSVDGTPLF